MIVGVGGGDVEGDGAGLIEDGLAKRAGAGIRGISDHREQRSDFKAFDGVKDGLADGAVSGFGDGRGRATRRVPGSSHDVLPSKK